MDWVIQPNWCHTLSSFSDFLHSWVTGRHLTCKRTCSNYPIFVDNFGWPSPNWKTQTTGPVKQKLNTIVRGPRVKWSLIPNHYIQFLSRYRLMRRINCLLENVFFCKELHIVAILPCNFYQHYPLFDVLTSKNTSSNTVKIKQTWHFTLLKTKKTYTDFTYRAVHINS